MKTYKIKIRYSVLGAKYTEDGYVREADSVSAHRSAVMSLPKRAKLLMITVKGVEMLDELLVHYRRVENDK